MKGLRNTVGVLGAAGMILAFSTSVWAAAVTTVTSGGPGAVAIGAGATLLNFKTSPNVRVSYNSDATHTSYTAGSVHTGGDKAYGVDPDYTGMYVKTVAAGTTDPGIPSAVAGSSGDFASGWTAK